jgi:dipeptidyl aminopeptidase/acylaminoacyl peptidase
MQERKLIVVVGLALAICACSTNRSYDPVTEDIVVVDEKYLPATKQVWFKSEGVELYGYLLQAQGPGPHPTVVFARGFPDPFSLLDIATPLRRAEFNSFLFLYRGFWGMDGNYTMMNSLKDLKAAIGFLRSEEAMKELRVDGSRVILHGYSFGAPIVLKAASEDPTLRAVASIDGSDLREYKNPSDKDRDTAIKEITSTRGIHFSPTQVIDELIAQQDYWDPVKYAPAFDGKCVLFVLATKGAGSEHYDPAIADLLRSRTKFTEVTLDTTHSFADKRIALTRAVLSWAEQLKSQGCL